MTNQLFLLDRNGIEQLAVTESNLKEDKKNNKQERQRQRQRRLLRFWQRQRCFSTRERQTSNKARSRCCCLLSCCGMNLRYIVILFDVIALAFSITSVVLDFTEKDDFVTSEELFGAKQEELELATHVHSLYSLASIVTHIVAIIGAQSYNTLLVGIGAFWLLVGLMLNLYTNIPMYNDDFEHQLENQSAEITNDHLSFEKIGISTAISTIFFYPHVCFMIVYRTGQPSQSKTKNNKNNNTNYDFNSLVPIAEKASKDAVDNVEMILPDMASNPNRQVSFADQDDDTANETENNEWNTWASMESDSFFRYVHSQFVRGAS